MVAVSLPASALAALVDQVLQHADADVDHVMAAGNGPHPAFDMDTSKTKMRTSGSYKGSANNIFVCDWSKPPPAQPPYTMAELDQIIKDDWDVAKAMMAGAGLHWKRPVTCAVTAIGEIHDLHVLSNQKPAMAFFKGWLRWLDAPAETPHRSEALRLHRQAALHCPIDYVSFTSGVALERNLFIASMSLLESTRKVAMQDAPSAWGAICVFAQARSISATSRDQAGALGILEQVDYADTSEYNLKKPGKKSKNAYVGQSESDASSKVAAALLFYDRATQGHVDVGTILLELRDQFGPKHMLDVWTNLTGILSCQVAAAVEKEKIVDMLAAVVTLLGLRMNLGLVEANPGQTYFQTKELPKVIAIVKILWSLPESFPYEPDSPEAKLLSLSDKLSWQGESIMHAKDHPGSLLMLSRVSAQRVHKFKLDLITGEHDATLSNMVHKHTKLQGGLDLFKHAELGGQDLLQCYQEEESLKAKAVVGVGPAGEAPAATMTETEPEPVVEPTLTEEQLAAQAHTLSTNGITCSLCSHTFR